MDLGGRTCGGVLRLASKESPSDTVIDSSRTRVECLKTLPNSRLNKPYDSAPLFRLKRIIDIPPNVVQRSLPSPLEL